MKVNLKKNRGITLIALVITIIVLLILAGVSIAMLTGQNGILTQAQNAAEQTEISNAKEQAQMDILAWQSDKLEKGESTDLNNEIIKGILEGKEYVGTVGEDSFTTKNGKYTIPYGELYKAETTVDTGETETVVDGVTIPKGFTQVSSLGTTKEQGIVIEDGEENQYVWVPVTKNEDGTPTEPYTESNGKLTKADGTQVEIQLGRYSFDKTTGVPSAYSGSNTEDTPENHNSAYGNIIAKDIEGFKESVKKNGGYYIARYEAGIEGGTLNTEDMLNDYTAPNKDWTGYTGDNMKLVSKSGAIVWNYITQNRAANICRDLADTKGYSGVTSDLLNSYAWDTAIVYIQNCGTNNNYANQVGKSTTSSAPSKAGEAILAQGPGATNNDVQCNIYDMAGNCKEWTTETSIGGSITCVIRGGYCTYSDGYTSRRADTSTTTASSSNSFRPLLYL